MLTRIEVHHFQSLHDISLNLSPFTVIVGPSSTGKSAFTRALHTLVHNRRGTEWIEHGERLAIISATNDRGMVTLRRGAATADNSYTILPTSLNEQSSHSVDSHDHNPADPRNSAPQSLQSPNQPIVFTKLGASTPEEVSRFLGIMPDSGTFASQHDMPFMLADTASSVATTLGKLTNVNVIFDAAREANRQKLTASQQLKTRADDLDTIKERLTSYSGLREQLAALDRAEQLLTAARTLETRLQRLTSLIETITVTERALPRLHALADADIPSTLPIEVKQAEIDRLSAVLAEIQASGTAVRTSQAMLTTTAAKEADLTDEFAHRLGSLEADIKEFMQSKLHERRNDIHDMTVELAAEWAAEFIVEILS
jgi:hypothetical protein